jgi:hypothetical protein
MCRDCMVSSFHFAVFPDYLLSFNDDYLGQRRMGTALNLPAFELGFAGVAYTGHASAPLRRVSRCLAI